jgi:hypothetical protein
VNASDMSGPLFDNFMIGLYDADGDLVVLSDSIPNDQTFTVPSIPFIKCVPLGSNFE